MKVATLNVELEIDGKSKCISFSSPFELNVYDTYAVTCLVVHYIGKLGRHVLLKECNSGKRNVL